MFDLDTSAAWMPPMPGSLLPRPAPEAPMLMRVLDEIDYGVMLVDASGALRYANQIARREVLRGGPLRLSQGQVGAASAHDQAVLATALADAQRGRRRLFALGQNGGALPVAVVPMAADDGEGEALAMLVLGKRPDNDTLSIDFYARSHGLTGAELTVLKRMAGGLKPKEVAREQGVAISTVRSHICSIRNKTQTGSIRDLLNRVAALPPITPLIKAPAAAPALAHVTH